VILASGVVEYFLKARRWKRANPINAGVGIDQDQILRAAALAQFPHQIGSLSPEREGSTRDSSGDRCEVVKVGEVDQLTMAVKSNKAQIFELIHQGGEFQVRDRLRQFQTVSLPWIDAVLAVLLQHFEAITLAADGFPGGVLLLTEFVTQRVGVDRCEPV